jgi:ZIP family zinc transporter
MSGALLAAFWGLVGGSALVLGVLITTLVTVPRRLVAAIMAFGSGVLISALSFDLMQEAFESGGFPATAAGFLAGAAIYTAINIAITHRGGHDRKRSGHQQQKAQDGSGVAIAVGALLDGIPESMVIGTSLLAGKGVSVVAVVAVFLSNVPEGLSSAAGMRRAGRSASYIYGVWGGIAIASGIAAAVGYLALAGAPAEYVAAVTAVAAGAILAMIADTMIPEAFETAHEYAGLVTVAGFLVAFALTKIGGG